jgi:AcrR family transcriptional regulator
MAKGSLREQQQELTRELIFNALVDVVLEEGVHAFSVGRVAERAGVSPRTVYRHFPTRQALLDEIGEWTTQDTEHRRAEPTSAAELPEQTRQLFTEWDTEEAAVRAFAIIRMTTGMQPRERGERVKRVDALIDNWASHASEEDRARARHALRALATVITWSQMRSDLGITGAEAGDAVAYAMQLMLDDLTRRERAAAAAPPGNGRRKRGGAPRASRRDGDGDTGT